MDKIHFHNTLSQAASVSGDIAQLSMEVKQNVLRQLARLLRLESDKIIACNAMDLVKLSADNPIHDRLLLSRSRIEEIANSLEQIIILPDPVGLIVEERVLPNSLILKRLTVPLGVVGLIYESRPNVTIDAFALCFMSGNVCILKGGREAYHTNEILMELIQHALVANNISPHCAQLLPYSREVTEMLCKAKGLVDVLIPRGGQGLINFVRENATIPVIETGAGVVHIYFDESGDLGIGKDIIFNAKTRKLAACNALDCLVMHQKRLNDLPFLLAKLLEHKTHIIADQEAYDILYKQYPDALISLAQDEDFGIEFLANKLVIKTVKNLEEAINHINKCSSRHSEGIITTDKEIIEQFFKLVDAAVLYANTSTAFTDGVQFGMGGEIGISTQKLHVRGPFSMQHLVTSKWLVYGEGHIRI